MGKVSSSSLEGFDKSRNGGLGKTEVDDWLAPIAGRRAVILGGAGFLGSHLSQRLVGLGARVTIVDNLLTGMPERVSGILQPDIDFVRADIATEIPLADERDIDFVLHFASAASPVDYARYPIETLRTGSRGTENALELALRSGATFMLASTSEVYGDPLVSPQHENYWGNVNSVGPRSVYDEAKRYAEALTMAYHRSRGLDVKIPRIFNTFGPGMRPNDGRAVPAFMMAALKNQPLPVHGDGSQTRSLCYVDDLVDGLILLLRSDHIGPMNIGNPRELSMLELAELIMEVTGSSSDIDFHPRPVDDPEVRVPDIALAADRLGWWPQVTLKAGLLQTADWFEPFALNGAAHNPPPHLRMVAGE